MFLLLWIQTTWRTKNLTNRRLTRNLGCPKKTRRGNIWELQQGPGPRFARKSFISLGPSPSCHRMQHGTPNEVWQRGVSVRIPVLHPQLDSVLISGKNLSKNWKSTHAQIGDYKFIYSSNVYVMCVYWTLCTYACVYLFVSLKRALEHVWSNNHHRLSFYRNWT